MRLDSILAWADEDDRSEQSLKVRGLQLFLQLHVSARLWFICFPRNEGDPLWSIAMASVATLAFAIGLFPRFARPAVALTAATMFVKLALTFPMSSNHFLFELLNVLLLVSLNARNVDERGLLLTASRWITVIVIFHTGLQKLLYGTYFEGQFLAYAIATRDSFGDVFKLVLPAEEFSRLVHSHPRRMGAGPFTIQSPLFLLVSNGVYVFELLAPAFLLMRRTRTAAAVGVIGFMTLVQAGARELFFAAVLVHLLLLFLPRALNYRLLPVFAAFYVLLLGARFWIAPGFEIH